MAKYILGGIEFSSKAKIKAYAQMLLKTTPEGSILVGTDLPVICDLLKWHHKADQLIGCGIQSIRVEKHVPFASSAGFTLVRVDGTEEIFSYNKCLVAQFLGSTSLKEKATKAFRVAIQSQINLAKQSFIDEYQAADGLVWSPTEDTWMALDEMHLDHYPMSFALILEGFLKRYRLSLEAIHLDTSGVLPDLPDGDIRTAWIDWHKERAQYRLISAALNVSLGAHEQPRLLGGDVA